MSCLIITYNYGRFLARAIDSVLDQDYPPESVEIIVIDDGSQDNTEDVVAPYLDRVRYVRKPNGGLVSSVSCGLEVATGEFIALLDADDTFTADKLRRQVGYLLTHPEVGLVYADLEVMDEDDNLVHPSFFQSSGLVPRSGRIFGQLLKHNCVPMTLVFRSTLRERVCPVPGWAPYADWWIALRAAEISEVHCIPGVVGRYRRHGTNMGLGISAEDHLRKHAVREVPFRRRMLLMATPENTTPQEVLDAQLFLEFQANSVTEQLGLDAVELLQIADADTSSSIEAQQLAESSVRSGAIGAAIHRFAVALIHDPWNQTARAGLAGLIDQVAGAHGGRPASVLHPNASVIVSASSNLDGVRRSLRALRATGSIGRYEVIAVVDEQGTDPSVLDFVRREISAGHLRSVRTQCSNDNDARAWNAGARASGAPFVAFLSGGMEARPGWLSRGLAVLSAQPRVGVVGAAVLSASDDSPCAGITFGDIAVPQPIVSASDATDTVLVPALAGSSFILPRDIWKTLGGFDEDADLELSQIDFCLRSWAAGRMVACCLASSVSASHEIAIDDGAVGRLVRSWAGRWPAAVRQLVGTATLPDGMRRSVTLAIYEELLANPDLLRAYVTSFKPTDDATLVVYAANMAPTDAGTQLLELMRTIGAHDVGVPDILVLTATNAPRARTVLEHAADAYLSRAA